MAMASSILIGFHGRIEIHTQSRTLESLERYEFFWATNNYDTRLIIGHEVATVYKGTLEGRTVAIKTPQDLNPTDYVIDFFLNQVTTKLQIDHKNVVKLFGCCIETQIPILVFEFISNGNLFNHLHGNGDVGPRWISWPVRVRIATEISYALSYMHCATAKRIVHWDVRSWNIFLDENYTAKLSNFGFSVSILPGETFIGLEVEGGYGYIDPEYLKTGRVTEKCDVYGFGVVLLELLTGKQRTQVIQTDAKLVNFILSKERESILGAIEGRILEEGSREDIDAFAELAFRCLRGTGEERPTMKEVVQELRRIQNQSGSCSTK
ncbi:hypothetical protein HHK36_023180 [Tetracentron sinense]|uniref:Protein kinase domain-containing protein n=1 Tax=Tetracentron sinense TaxID=13715 RepID=A0A834YPZ7_TETSI|nr:hypothetical protein HHK36_023180 [Tetracentron sinense]